MYKPTYAILVPIAFSNNDGSGKSEHMCRFAKALDVRIHTVGPPGVLGIWGEWLFFFSGSWGARVLFSWI